MKAVGQTDFLLPVGSTALPWLKHRPGVRIALDPGTWPPGNLHRPTLSQYVAELLTWRLPDGSWGNLDWAAAYDHIGDPARTQRDEHALLGQLEEADAANCPVVPVVHYGHLRWPNGC